MARINKEFVEKLEAELVGKKAKEKAKPKKASKKSK